MEHVLVTGASGFVASTLIEQLLAAGHRVRGTVRSVAKAPAQLKALPGAAERLEFVEAELLKPGAFTDAVKGVSVVMHTASPYVLDVVDPQKDLVDPAVRGTVSVLEAAMASPSVRRVVLTSSLAAVTDEPENDHTLTEADWNTKSSLDRNPYYFSKAQAERAGWDFVEKNEPTWDLVVVNPYMIVGPSVVPGLNYSNKVFADLINGAYPAILSLAWGWVDVRDVALAHVRAMERVEAKGRYICAGPTISMRRVVETLRAKGVPGKLPSFGLDNAFGNAVTKLSSYTQSKGVGDYLRTHVGKVPRIDTSKIQKELGLSYRPFETTLLDTIADLKRWGHLKA